MPVAQSVFGYVPDAVARDLHEGRGFGKEVLELPLDPRTRAHQLRVRSSDIEEVRVGPSSGGHTSLQLILKPEASYEFMATPLGEAELLPAIQDPSFWYGPGRLNQFVIFAGPIYRRDAAGIFGVSAGKSSA